MKRKVFLLYQINGEWKTFYEGDTIGERKNISFPAQEMEKIRFVMKEYDNFPAIYELTFFKG
jgi:hypothetical protein